MKVARNHAHGRWDCRAMGLGTVGYSATNSFTRKFFFAFTEVLVIFGFRANTILFVKCTFLWRMVKEFDKIFTWLIEINVFLVILEALNFISFRGNLHEKTAHISRCHHWFPCKNDIWETSTEIPYSRLLPNGLLLARGAYDLQYHSKVNYHPLTRRELRHTLRDSCSVRWPKNCKYHCQNSWAFSRINDKDLLWLIRKQNLTSVTCRLLCFVKDRYLRIFAKHAFNKVTLKPLHHLKNYIFSKNFELSHSFRLA